jgi:hypothetical protein
MLLLDEAGIEIYVWSVLQALYYAAVEVLYIIVSDSVFVQCREFIIVRCARWSQRGAYGLL